MVDNVELSSGSGGATVKTDDDGTAHWQYVKIAYGADNTQTRVTTAAPLPVDLRTDNLAGNLDVNIAAQTSDITIADGGNTITVDGTVTANLSATDNSVLDQIEANTSYGDNTGGGAEAGCLRVTLANDSTGVVSIDDNNGSITVDSADLVTLAGAVSGSEMQVDIVSALPAGANAIGKLSSNSGVDIGDVDVTSVIPGTTSASLGKAIDSVVGATDTGILLLGKHQEDQVHLSTSDGDYDALTIDSLGSLHVNAEAHHIFDELGATTGWSALSNDTLNLATTTKHVMGILALTFDKVNGAANTALAGIQKTLTSTDLGDVSPHDILQSSFYIPDLTDVSYVFLRLGTDSSNYNEWRLDASTLTAGVFETGALTIGDADYNGITGNGMNSSAVSYIALGVAFNAETDTLAGIVFDQVSYHTNQHTSTSINSEVSSSVSSANVNINKIGNKVVNTEAGNVATGTQRITIATDDANLSAIKTAAELVDDCVYVDDADWVAASSKHALIGGVYSSSPRAVTDGDTAPLAIDVNGHAITSAHAASVVLSDNVSNTANLMVDEADAFMGSATFGYMFDGSAWDRLRGDAVNGLTVNLGSNNDVILGVSASGGAASYRNLDVDETEDEVKGTAGQIYWLHAMNATAAPLYLKIYDATAASVVVGTTAPKHTFMIPTAGDTNGAGFNLSVPNGIEFGTAITVACTTALADADTGAPGANALVLNMGYA